MPTVEFKRENGKLFFRSLKVIEDYEVHVNDDGDEFYGDVCKVAGWTEWQEMP